MRESPKGQGAALTLRAAGDLVGGRVAGEDGEISLTGIRPVDEAGPDELAFLARRRYARYLADARAGAFLVAEELEGLLPPGVPRIVTDEPHRALRILLDHYHVRRSHEPSIHPTAVIGRNVRLGGGVTIGPYAVLEDEVVVGDGTRVGAHCVLGRGSHIGDEGILHPHVVVYDGCRIGDRVILHAGVRIGADGFGYVLVDGAHQKVPQVGRVLIGDDVEIGANSTIDRGSLGDTVLGDGVKIDNLVQVAHNVKVGARSLLAALVGVAGSTRIGRGAWLGGQAGVIDHLEIGDGARIATTSKVFRDVGAGETVSGHPARPHREQLRSQALVTRLPKLLERVRRIEAALRDRG